MRNNRMPTPAKFYISAIVAAGSVLLAGAALLWSCPFPFRFLACLCLAVLASTFKVKMPGMESCITPNFVPILFAAGSMSWQETVVMTAVAGVVQTIWKPKGRLQAVQIFFNGANLALSMGSAYALAHWMAPNQVLVQLGIAAIMYEVLDTLSVSAVIQLITQAPLRAIWRNCHLWTFPYHLAGAVVVSFWLQADLIVGLSFTVIGALALYLMSMFYQELVNRAAPGERSPG
jgi:hypothetical protein